jgi:hypothetical protein
MIQIRLPWRRRARPSATLHEIQVCPERQTCSYDATQGDGVRQQEVGIWKTGENPAPSDELATTSLSPILWKYPSGAAPGRVPAKDKSGKRAGETIRRDREVVVHRFHPLRRFHLWPPQRPGPGLFRGRRYRCRSHLGRGMPQSLWSLSRNLDGYFPAADYENAFGGRSLLDDLFAERKSAAHRFGLD